MAFVGLLACSAQANAADDASSKPRALPQCSPEQLAQLAAEEKTTLPPGQIQLGHSKPSNANSKMVKSQLNRKRDERALEMGCRRP